jgi:hypothetical protein
MSAHVTMANRPMRPYPILDVHNAWMDDWRDSERERQGDFNQLMHRIGLGLSSPQREQTLRVWDWMQHHERAVTLREIQDHFGWSAPHTVVVCSRLPLTPLR